MVFSKYLVFGYLDSKGIFQAATVCKTMMNMSGRYQEYRLHWQVLRLRHSSTQAEEQSPGYSTTPNVRKSRVGT